MSMLTYTRACPECYGQGFRSEREEGIPLHIFCNRCNGVGLVIENVAEPAKTGFLYRMTARLTVSAAFFVIVYWIAHIKR